MHVLVPASAPSLSIFIFMSYISIHKPHLNPPVNTHTIKLEKLQITFSIRPILVTSFLLLFHHHKNCTLIFLSYLALKITFSHKKNSTADDKAAYLANNHSLLSFSAVLFSLILQYLPTLQLYVYIFFFSLYVYAYMPLKKFINTSNIVNK